MRCCTRDNSLWSVDIFTRISTSFPSTTPLVKDLTPSPGMRWLGGVRWIRIARGFALRHKDLIFDKRTILVFYYVVWFALRHDKDLIFDKRTIIVPIMPYGLIW